MNNGKKPTRQTPAEQTPAEQAQDPLRTLRGFDPSRIDAIVAKVRDGGSPSADYALAGLRAYLPVTQQNATLLRLPEVMARTGLARSTVYLHMKQGNFPAAVRLGDRAVAWRES